jgi:type IV secretory pathway TrbD component
VPWTEVFAVLVVSHLFGDFVLQTQWMASHKHGGLGGDPQARAALAAHIATYLLSFVPALIWIWSKAGFGVAVGTLALVGLPHTIQDDGRLLASYVRGVKHVAADVWDQVFLAVDQSLHVLALFLAALVVGS